MMRKLLRTQSNNGGQASVEFLLSGLLCVTMIFAAVQMIIFIYTYTVLAQAAKVGVRYAVVHGANNASPSGPGNTTGVEAAVNRIANYSGMTITVTYPDGSNSPPNRVRVQIAYPFTTFSLGWTLPTVRASGLGRITF